MKINGVLLSPDSGGWLSCGHCVSDCSIFVPSGRGRFTAAQALWWWHDDAVLLCLQIKKGCLYTSRSNERNAFVSAAGGRLALRKLLRRWAQDSPLPQALPSSGWKGAELIHCFISSMKNSCKSVWWGVFSLLCVAKTSIYALFLKLRNYVNNIFKVCMVRWMTFMVVCFSASFVDLDSEMMKA